jgi:hypothetical protein
MAELRCADGTVVQISAETEKELRKAFGESEPTFKVGDIFWKDTESGGTHYTRLVVWHNGDVALRATNKTAEWGNTGGHKRVNDINAITMAEVQSMTSYPAGLRPVETFTVIEK